MKDAKVSAGRGKTFERRPDLKIEAVTREVFDQTHGTYSVAMRTILISLPRVRWLERKTA